jgi:predicted DNA-binding transcriptional regulator AlpA
MKQTEVTSNTVKSKRDLKKQGNKRVKQLLLNCRDAAELCGVNPKTWRTWGLLGYTPMPLQIGKSLFWRADELIQWIGEGCPKRADWLYRPPKNLENRALYTD